MSTSTRAALLLAAGSSVRMGFPKALLPWGESTLLEFQICQLRAAGAGDIVVVLGAHARRVRPLVPALPGVRAVYNRRHREGRSSSIRCGARNLRPNARVVLVESVDQPCPSTVQEELFRVAEDTGAAVVIPTFGGRRGHPIVLARHVLPELLELSEEEQGLRAVVRSHARDTVEVPVNTDVVLWNLNDPQEYALAHRRFFTALGGSTDMGSPSPRV